jgi:hypothetical protein
MADARCGFVQERTLQGFKRAERRAEGEVKHTRLRGDSGEEGSVFFGPGLKTLFPTSHVLKRTRCEKD